MHNLQTHFHPPQQADFYLLLIFTLMKTKKPYIITADLEKTGLPELDPTVASLVLQDIRMNTANAINKAL